MYLMPAKIDNYISSTAAPDFNEFNRMIESAFRDKDKDFKDAMEKAGIVHLDYFSLPYGEDGGTNDTADVLNNTKQLRRCNSSVP